MRGRTQSGAHRSAFVKPPDWRKTPASPVERTTCSLKAWPRHGPPWPAGSGRRSMGWLVIMGGAPRAPGWAGPGRRTDDRSTRKKTQNKTDDRKRFGEIWDRSGRLFVPLFSDVKTTQCEEEDGKRQDTETERQTDSLSSARSSSSNVLKSPSCSP